MAPGDKTSQGGVPYVRLSLGLRILGLETKLGMQTGGQAGMAIN